MFKPSALVSYGSTFMTVKSISCFHYRIHNCSSKINALFCYIGKGYPFCWCTALFWSTQPPNTTNLWLLNRKSKLPQRWMVQEVTFESNASLIIGSHSVGSCVWTSFFSGEGNFSGWHFSSNVHSDWQATFSEDSEMGAGVYWTWRALCMCFCLCHEIKEKRTKLQTAETDLELKKASLYRRCCRSRA